MEQKIRKRQSHDFIQRTFVVSKTTNRRFYEVKRNKKKISKTSNSKVKKLEISTFTFFSFEILSKHKAFVSFVV